MSDEFSGYLFTYLYGAGTLFTDENDCEYAVASVAQFFHYVEEDGDIPVWYYLVDTHPDALHEEGQWISQDDLMKGNTGWELVEPCTKT